MLYNLTSSSAHTSSALRACTAADITPSTLSSNAKRSRKSRPASSRVDVTLPFRTDTYSPAHACKKKKKKKKKIQQHDRGMLLKAKSGTSCV